MSAARNWSTLARVRSKPPLIFGAGGVGGRGHSRRNDMAQKAVAAALSVLVAASPVSAHGTQDLTAGAPPGNAETKYCLRAEPITGTRIPTVACLTREEWAEGNVDVDRVWAEDGVGVEA